MRRLLVLALTAVIALGLTACAKGPSTPSDEPGITGEVKTISYGGDEESAVEGVLGTILVETPPSGDSTAVAKANVTVTDSTAVSLRSGDKLEKSAFEEIVEGDTVEVWFDGPVAESYPLQGRAKSIVVTP